MNLKEKRVMVLKEVDRLLKLRCEKCIKSSNTIKSMLCDCPASKGIRNCGKQLDELLTDRYWDGKIKNIKKRQTLTLSEYIELLEFEVRRNEIAEVLNVFPSRLSRWASYYGLSSEVRKSKEKTKEILKLNGHVLFIKEGFNYYVRRKEK